LIGRDPTTGDWSWSTAGTAWEGLGTFTLAVGTYITPGGSIRDQTIGVPGYAPGQMGETLLNAGKSIIAYDEWGKDPARAAGTTAFNIVAALVGTKGAGAGLRAAGVAAKGSRVGVVASAGTFMVRAGEAIGKLPTVSGLVKKIAAESRLAALVPDAVLLSKLRQLCPDAELLERLLLKIERPETLEKYLGRMGPSELEKAIESTAARGVPQGLTEGQFAQMSARIRAAAGKYGDDIRVQGSRAAGAAAKDTKDIDVAIRVSPERFREIIKERFKVPKPGSSMERTMLHAIKTGKIQRGELRLSSVGREIEKELGMEVDISVVRIGGATDNGPWIPLK
jgi:hypothetical protein